MCDDLINACYNGELKKIEYYLTSPDIEPQIAINAKYQVINNTFKSLLMIACEFGDIEVVKYLLLSPNLKEHSNINHAIYGDTALSYAALHGRKNIVDFLLYSPQLKEHANIIPAYTTIELQDGKAITHTQTSIMSLEHALLSEDLEIVDIFFNHEHIKKNQYFVHNAIDNIINNLMENECFLVVEYLIINQYIKDISSFKDILHEDTEQSLLNLINKTMLHKNLQSDLNKNERRSFVENKKKI